MTKLVVCYIGENVDKYIKMSLDSIRDVADAIVFVDGGSKDKTKDIVLKEKNLTLIDRRFEHEHKGANGRARNAYLKYIQAHFKGWWCLVLDPDEIVENTQYIKPLIRDVMKKHPANEYILNPHMRHFIRDLGHEDSTEPIHHCPGRLFQITDTLFYGEVEHSVLQCEAMHLRIDLPPAFTMWHMAYCGYAFDIKKRYENHIKKSNMHTKSYLDDWYLAHVSGQYPTKRVDLQTLPKLIKDHFFPGELQDAIYFKERRQLELKHYHEVMLWKKFFKPKHALFVGCGMGQRVFTANELGIDACGFDKNKYAINNSPFKDDIPHKLWMDDVLKIRSDQLEKFYDLVVVYDVLEHLEEKDLLSSLYKLYAWTKKYVLISVPVIGDPNLEKDPTHKIKKEKEWWINQIKKVGFKIIETPDTFLFRDQIIVGEK